MSMVHSWSNAVTCTTVIHRYEEGLIRKVLFQLWLGEMGQNAASELVKSLIRSFCCLLFHANKILSTLLIFNILFRLILLYRIERL